MPKKRPKDLAAKDLKPGLRFRYQGADVEILREREVAKDRFGQPLDRWWSRNLGTGQEGYVSLGPAGKLYNVEPLSAAKSHATKKSPAQLDREIAEVLGRWEEDPFEGYRFNTTSDGVRFDTAGVDPTYHRDPKWRQRWEFDLKREIAKFKAGKPTKLYKMSETHYRLPGTV